MSKNVAVFVDVANIFYAAKAAGVDIDYVTLLKASTAGRDFVRAYAYTGLDPENENQRQFHSFLTRSGYKVVSKDIRKYGDGRIKANLDIELVVDMMRMAQHIDIAVVVSGDGDFAPAIRAIQQQGVRVEVVSFRGNTSSDLIEVADVFTDISQLARVERGERSGRRVASEDDLSMTAVPEKETETGTRRRRGEGRRSERSERPERTGARRAAPEAAEGSNLIVLPGERLSRAPADEDQDEVVEDGTVIEIGSPDGEIAEGTAEGDGRRRRRRRGGRGRGRGRRAEGETPALLTPEGEPIEDAVLEDELLEEEVALAPQHSTFGSVWESQLGVAPSAPIQPSVDDQEGYDDEPEIPEYLLAERRAQGRGRGRNQGGGRGPGGRGQGGYRSAIDRERYGRSGAPATGGYNRDRAGGQGQGRGQGRSQAQPRPQPRPVAPVRDERPSASAEPWSEVPAEVQELLRAELARRQSDAGRTHQAPEPATAEPVTEAAEAPAKTTRRRTTKASTEPVAAEPVTEAAEAPAKAPAKTTRRRTTKATTEPVAAEPVTEAAEAPAKAPAKTTRRRTTKAATEPATAEPVTEAAEAPAKTTRRRTTKTAAPVEG